MKLDLSKGINWVPTLFIGIYHALLVVVLPVYLYLYTPSLLLWVLTFTLLSICALSITAGYHRLYSHKAFQTHPVVETIILFFATLTAQGSALRWSNDHRIHHAYVDTDDDPYSIKKGFWYAHMLWLMEKPKEIDPKVVPDLLANPRVAFQDCHYGLLLTISLIFTWGVGALLTGDAFGALALVTLLRLFLQQHCTWFINSLAHTWGSKPFCQEQTAVNNIILAFLTFGEGYHNYHHTYANDYRNGVKWYHYDPTKWLIWGLARLGLAKGLRQMDALTIQKKLVLERKNLLQGRLQTLWYVKKEEMELTIQELSEQLLEKIAKMKELHRQIRNSDQKALVQDLRNEFRSLKKRMREDWRLWRTLSKSILRMKPVPKLFSCSNAS